MLGALVVFAAASAGAALSRDLGVLVGFRILQAAAACAIVPNGLGLLRGASVEGRAGMYFGISGATTGIGAAVGPLLGGLLAAVDWRWIFAVNVPLVALILALGWRTLPHAEHRRTARADVAGALSLGALLAGAAVSVAGVIGFVGLMTPHVMRLVVGADHRRLLPAVLLAGPVFLVLADLVARVVIAPQELPLGAVTALVGGPFFLYLLRRERGRASSRA